jgi:hypothetical protein
MDRSIHLCAITDATLVPGRDHVAVAEAALTGGADMIQLRDKAPDLRLLLTQARRIRALCAARGALFIVNDRLDLALAAEADGAHVGQEDLPATPRAACSAPTGSWASRPTIWAKPWRPCRPARTTSASAPCSGPGPKKPDTPPGGRPC